MNKRIEEFAAECTDYIEGTLDGTIKEFDYKKFAELLVKECAKVVDSKLDFTFASGPDARASGDDLLEHFGVK